MRHDRAGRAKAQSQPELSESIGRRPVACGFFGSGKSHLVKALQHLWLDYQFPDGAKARGLAKLPQNIKDLLTELSNQAKKYGGLHAAAGTLGAGAGDDRTTKVWDGTPLEGASAAEE